MSDPDSKHPIPTMTIANGWAVMDGSGEIKAAGRSLRVLIATDKSARAFGPDGEDADAEAIVELASLALEQACAAIPPGARQATLAAAVSMIVNAGASEAHMTRLRVPTVPFVLDLVRELAGDKVADEVQASVRVWMAQPG